jgi:hypothetical protein
MKATHAILGILVAAIFVLMGCGKSAPPPPLTAEGVAIDLPKLQAAFPSPTPEIRSRLEETAFGLRYDDYNKALAQLDQLANAPNLTEQQKKAVSDVAAQVKKAADSHAAKAGK